MQCQQFVRGQSDPELKKYLWVVIRTQKERKLQTLIEVCTDFASLGQAMNVHRPVEQVFALEEDEEPEDLVAMIDRSQWTGPGVSETQMSPSLKQMFTHFIHYSFIHSFHFDRGAIILRLNVSAAVKWGIHKLAAQAGLDTPFRPDGWNMRSDGLRQRNNGPSQGNEI